MPEPSIENKEKAVIQELVYDMYGDHQYKPSKRRNREYHYSATPNPEPNEVLIPKALCKLENSPFNGTKSVLSNNFYKKAASYTNLIGKSEKSNSSS